MPLHNNADRIPETRQQNASRRAQRALEACTFKEIRKLWRLIIAPSAYRIRSRTFLRSEFNSGEQREVREREFIAADHRLQLPSQACLTRDVSGTTCLKIHTSSLTSLGFSQRKSEGR